MKSSCERGEKRREFNGLAAQWRRRNKSEREREKRDFVDKEGEDCR